MLHVAYKLWERRPKGAGSGEKNKWSITEWMNEMTE